MIADATIREDEPREVRRWRFTQFRELGFDKHDAYLLAANENADPHDAADLIEAGCPLEVAERILS